MKDWNRRQWLQAMGFSSLGLTLTGFSEPTNAPIIHTSTSGSIRRLLYNENPNGPSEIAKRRIAEVTDRSNRYATFHKYDYLALKKLIAEQEGLQPGNVLLGHGSFELLTWLAVHYTQPGHNIVVPSPSFDVVGAISRKIGGTVHAIEVNDDFQLDLASMEAKISAQTNLLTLCNPNNPTGRKIDTPQLRRFCESISQKVPVLVDEAYIHYLESWKKHTMAPLIAEGKQVLITRTFSKIYGMAGLRVGFLLGPESLISALETKFTMGFPGNMPNTLSVAAAMGALEDEQFLQTSSKFNRAGKGRLYRALKELDIPYLKSEANFVYFDVGKFSAFKAHMRQKDIILAGGWPSKPNWARVTIGREEEMSYFVKHLQGKAWMR